MSLSLPLLTSPWFMRVSNLVTPSVFNSILVSTLSEP